VGFDSRCRGWGFRAEPAVPPRNSSIGMNRRLLGAPDGECPSRFRPSVFICTNSLQLRQLKAGRIASCEASFHFPSSGPPSKNHSKAGFSYLSERSPDRLPAYPRFATAGAGSLSGGATGGRDEGEPSRYTNSKKYSVVGRDRRMEQLVFSEGPFYLPDIILNNESGTKPMKPE
jgi:hypothetical protein